MKLLTSNILYIEKKEKIQPTEETCCPILYALALGSNFHAEMNVFLCLDALSEYGSLSVSRIYQTAPENGEGCDYLNLAVILTSITPANRLNKYLKEIELKLGRIKPSAEIHIDVDLIAYGSSFDHMCFFSKRLPLADYVVIPMCDVWKTFEACIEQTTQSTLTF